MQDSRTAGPDAETVRNGAQYGIRIDRGGDNSSGAIWGTPGVIRWRYKARRNPSGHSLGNPFAKREFVVSDVDGIEVLVIRRASFIPPVFQIVEKGRVVVGRISLRSILRNRYRIDLGDGAYWTFRMPLFTVQFRGESSVGSHVWVIVGPSKMEWNLLAEPGVDTVPLLSALSFIHNEWRNYS